MNKLIYTWDEFFKDAALLAKMVEGNHFTGLLIITKGGLFLGSYLSEKLNIPYVETIGIKSYEAQERKAVQIIKDADFVKLPAKLLIVDDIADSGETLRYVVDHYKAPSVTLFRRAQGKYAPTWSLHETDQWVVFPWETL